MSTNRRRDTLVVRTRHDALNKGRNFDFPALYARVRRDFSPSPIGRHWTDLGVLLKSGEWADPEWCGIPGELEEWYEAPAECFKGRPWVAGMPVKNDKCGKPTAYRVRRSTAMEVGILD